MLLFTGYARLLLKNVVLLLLIRVEEDYIDFYWKGFYKACLVTIRKEELNLPCVYVTTEHDDATLIIFSERL